MLKLAGDDRPIAIASLFVLVILAFGSAYTLTTQGSLAFLNPGYLLQQLQVGAFLGIVAAGMMLVILLGHIDLSVPWTLAARGDGGHCRRRTSPCPSASASASPSGSSTASASPTCACRR